MRLRRRYLRRLQFEGWHESGLENFYMTQNFHMVCVVAIARNGIIGDGTDLIWHLPGDLKRVKQLTLGCPLIMGRRTFDSIGRALPGRLSVVMTRNVNWKADGAVAVASLAAAINVAKEWLVGQPTDENRLILFGGGQIYEEGLPYCQTIEATFVDVEPDDGVRFPEFDSEEWRVNLLQEFAADGDVPGFAYHRLTRKRPALSLT